MAVIYGNENKKYPVGKLGIVERWVDDATGSRGTWESDIVKWYKLRMRVKKTKTSPFPGCSNIRLPTLDVKIKKLKSQIRNGVLGTRPVVQAIPSPAGNYNTAIKIEKLLDHLLMEVIGYEPKFVITVDQAMESGFFINQPYWKLEIQTREHEFDIKEVPLQIAVELFKTEVTVDMMIDYLSNTFSVDKHDYVWADNYRELKKVAEKLMSGVINTKFKTQDVVYNYPDVALIPPDKCYVKNEGGYDPQTQPYIVIEKWLSLEYLKMMRQHHGWNIDGIEGPLEASEVVSNLDSVKDAKEGITSFNKTGKVKIYEAQGYIKGKKQFVISAPDFGTVIKESSLPMPSGKYNVVKFFHELREDRWYHHRGLPEILEDLVKEIDVQHMQKIDRQTIVNSPIFLYRAGMINQATTQFTFGEGIPVNGMMPISDVFQQMNNYNQAADFSYDREQQVLKADIDEYTGQIDYTLSQQLNRREPRTAQEVQAQSSAAAMVASLDLSIFRRSFEELANMVWELWCEYGDDEYEFKYFGQQQQQETIRLNKEEIQGKYTIKIRANDENTNPQMRIAKAQQILNAVSNQLAIQFGVVTPMNIAAAYKRFYQELNVNQAEELYTVPQPKEPGVPDKTLPKFADLDEFEQAQVLPKLGIKPNIQGRIANKQREVANERTDNLVNIVNSMK